MEVLVLVVFASMPSGVGDGAVGVMCPRESLMESLEDVESKLSTLSYSGLGTFQT
jgi:hypothetical protein